MGNLVAMALMAQTQQFITSNEVGQNSSLLQLRAQTSSMPIVQMGPFKQHVSYIWPLNYNRKERCTQYQGPIQRHKLHLVDFDLLYQVLDEFCYAVHRSCQGQYYSMLSQSPQCFRNIIYLQFLLRVLLGLFLYLLLVLQYRFCLLQYTRKYRSCQVLYWSWFHIVPNGLVIQSTGL